MALSGANAGHAAPPSGWTVDAERSQVAFDYAIDGTDRSGAFLRFEGAGRFDPARPEDARFELRIDTGSIDLGDRLASAYATSAEWFDTKTHGPVVFKLVRLEAVDATTFQALGTLTIKGRTRAARAPLRLVFAAGGATAEGRFEVERRTFDLGLGPSALMVDVSDDVAVRFRLEAVPSE